jgi:hypothetical protein
MKKKPVSTRGWAVIGTDGSYLDQIYWYKEHAIERWGGNGGGVKIIQVEIAPLRPKRKP